MVGTPHLAFLARMLPPRSLAFFLAVLGFAVCAPAAPPAGAADYVPMLVDGQVRVDGRVKSVAEDFQSLELEVVAWTPAGGKRELYAKPPARTVRLTRDTFVYRRSDRTAFLSPRELQPGQVVTLIVVPERASGQLVAGDVVLGGTLPVVPIPVPEKPEGPGVLPVLPSAGPGLAKFEPRTGCYLGAFVMQDDHVNGSMKQWEQTVGKGHASYLRYVGYGQPFPEAWVRDVRSVGAVPNLAFEPNDGLKTVKDDLYLREFAQAAAASGGPVFLRFASEMNGPWTNYHGNPALYRSKFRLVASVFHRLAPNVAMVWTPYCRPLSNIPSYYPGDDAVDWVGVNIYSVHHHNGDIGQPADQEDPKALLLPIYRRYAPRKPIQISEYAATSYCQACNTAMPQFAVRKMSALYPTLPTRFPRVKMIYWFSWDTISGGAAENNYSVAADETVLASYQRMIRGAYFLPRLPRPKPPRTKEALGGQ